MSDPHFLSLENVLEIHRYQIEHFGGDAAVLNQGLLESAIAQPRQGFGGAYLHADLAAMAAAYLYHIVRNHPFADGNKRTGTHAAIVFLATNGFEVELPVDRWEQIVLDVAQGKISKDALAEFVREVIS